MLSVFATHQHESAFSSVQLLSHVTLFATPLTAADQSSLTITNSKSLLKLMSIESVIHPTISPSVVPFSSCSYSFPASGSFLSQLFALGGQKNWSFNFSISLSSEYSVLISFKIDWFDLLEV